MVDGSLPAGQGPMSSLDFGTPSPKSTDGAAPFDAMLDVASLLDETAGPGSAFGTIPDGTAPPNTSSSRLSSWFSLAMLDSTALLGVAPKDSSLPGASTDGSGNETEQESRSPVTFVDPLAVAESWMREPLALFGTMAVPDALGPGTGDVVDTDALDGSGGEVPFEAKGSAWWDVAADALVAPGSSPSPADQNLAGADLSGEATGVPVDLGTRFLNGPTNVHLTTAVEPAAAAHAAGSSVTPAVSPAESSGTWIGEGQVPSGLTAGSSDRAGAEWSQSTVPQDSDIPVSDDPGTRSAFFGRSAPGEGVGAQARAVDSPRGGENMVSGYAALPPSDSRGSDAAARMVPQPAIRTDVSSFVEGSQSQIQASGQAGAANGTAGDESTEDQSTARRFLPLDLWLDRVSQEQSERFGSGKPTSDSRVSIGEGWALPFGRPADVAPRATSSDAGPTSPPAVVGSPMVLHGRPIAPLSTTAVATPDSTAGAENLDRLVQTMRVQVRDGMSEATVRLRPEHLGEVTITLRVEGGAVSTTIHAEAAPVRQWLESQQEMLRNGLAAHGLHLDRFVVLRDREEARRESRDPQPQRAPRPPRGEGRFEVSV